MKDKQPIIIKKIKKAGGHGHHGGAWKIAYADFVTAMMAFFLLMWLLSSASEEQLDGLAKYFAPTIGIQGQKGVGIYGGQDKNIEQGSQISDQGSADILDRSPHRGSVIEAPKEVEDPNILEQQNFSTIMQDLQKETQEDGEDKVAIDMTAEGLRIQILDDAQRPLFKPGTNELEVHTKEILQKIGKTVRALPNFVSVAGHTRSLGSSVSGKDNADKWLLSSARANAVREYMSDGIIDREQIFRIVGKADIDPFDPNDPTNVKNIRITLILMKPSLVGTKKRATPRKIFNAKKFKKLHKKATDTPGDKTSSKEAQNKPNKNAKGNSKQTKAAAQPAAKSPAVNPDNKPKTTK